MDIWFFICGKESDMWGLNGFKVFCLGNNGIGEDEELVCEKLI